MVVRRIRQQMPSLPPLFPCSAITLRGLFPPFIALEEDEAIDDNLPSSYQPHGDPGCDSAVLGGRHLRIAGYREGDQL